MVSMPYAGLCVSLLGSNLNAHAEPEKVQAIERYRSHLNPSPKGILSSLLLAFTVQG